MFEIGASLREARMNRNLSAEDVQKGIHIRARYLMALEEERWELLPGEAYAKGFLRTYAEFLGPHQGVSFGPKDQKNRSPRMIMRFVITADWPLRKMTH